MNAKSMKERKKIGKEYLFMHNTPLLTLSSPIETKRKYRGHNHIMVY